MIKQKYDLRDFDFEKIARKESNPRTRIRLLVLAHLKDGTEQNEVTKAVKVSESTVKRIYRKFKDSGLNALKDRSKSEANYKLPKDEHETFKNYILEQQKLRGGGRLTGYDIKDILKEKWNVIYNLGGVYRLLHHLGFSWISSRSRHPNHDEQGQETYKKTL